MTGASILIVEDDSTLRRGLEDNFALRGYQVSTAADGETGLEAALTDEHDLILLDIMLPNVNGFEVCRRIRAAELQMPIIMLTAKGQEEDIVRGLNLGADDYVTKPFSIKELLARVAAFLRRSEAGTQDLHCFGEFRLDLASHQLFKNGKEVKLTPKEFRMLEHLLRRAGRALTRDEIMDAVWDSGVLVTARSVDRCVTTLRSKIESDPRHPRFILTIRDIGYRFELPRSEERDDDTEPGLPATAHGAAGADGPDALAQGSLLGRYEIGELIGSGGMGRIFKAWDRQLEREVAVKVLSRHLVDRPEALARFKREARAVASLAHPSILSIFDVGTSRGLAYLVTELLKGETLRDRIRRGPLELQETIDLGIAVAEALATAHAKGVIHRDVKPSNIFLTADGGIRILDFGLAQLPRGTTDLTDADTASLDVSTVTLQTSPGSMIGTVGYVAPEQLRALPTDARSDLFALGCVLYEMICGRAPFVRDTLADVAAAILNDEPPPLERPGRDRDVPVELAQVVRRCLEKEPAKRFPGASEVAAALQAIDV